MIVFGLYQFMPKRTAFRNDFCLRCAGERVAVQIRSLYVGHVYWVPVLPVGFWKRWACAICGFDPHVPAGARNYKAIVVFLLAFLAIPAWLARPAPEEAGLIWMIRVLITGALAGMVWWMARGESRSPALVDGLARVRAYDSRTCPFCGGSLYDQPSLHCPPCGLRCESVGG